MIIYVVQRGDSIYSISQMFGVSPEQIIADNELTMPDSLVVGQTIVIVTDQIEYEIMSGDSLYSIARRYNISLQEILDTNPSIESPSQIFPGQKIIIPIPPEKIGSTEFNGYAFPNIRQEVLTKTLPNLTYISPFSYQVQPDGTFMSINDERIIADAKQNNVAPLMVLTNIDMDGGFNGELVNEIFSSTEIQQQLIDNILSNLEQKGYYGVDIDFEYLYPSDRENYNNFLRQLTTQAQARGFIVTTALAPKISADQEGILYEAHDYRAQGEIVDHIIIMTYEWGYTYGPPLAVSPINSVRQVLDYAVTEIPSEKIFMGIPNYGYDWTLPYKPGTMAQTISNIGAIDLAREKGAFIQYDEQSQAPYFYYYDESGRQHVVWFEDARSINAKLKLINEYNLGGASYWTINRYFPQNWLVQKGLFDTDKLI